MLEEGLNRAKQASENAVDKSMDKSVEKESLPEFESEIGKGVSPP